MTGISKKISTSLHGSVRVYAISGRYLIGKKKKRKLGISNLVSKLKLNSISNIIFYIA